MNALESASLVMIPSGYEDGTLGSLKPTDGTGDFTFTRGSNISATRVNADGNIEKGYENRLLQSNQFDTTWTLQGGATLGARVADPNGGNDAWEINFTTNTSSRIEQQLSVINGGVYTFSVYMRVPSGTQTIKIFTTISGGGFAKTLTDEWQRFELFGVSNGYTIAFPQLRNDTGIAYTAHIYAAQYNQGLVAYPYVETTTAPVAGGILEDMPRLDYSNGSCPSLLLEPSRTNLVPYSEYIEGLDLTDLTPTPNATTSPEGLQNAYKMLTGTTGGEQIAYQEVGTSGNTKTQSVYIKEDSGVQWIRFFQLRGGFSNSVSVFFDIQNGVKGSKSENGTTSVVDDATKIEDAGNGWYRLTLVCTDSTNNTQFDTRVRTAIADGSGTRVSNGSYFIWGYQMESDASYPTSYIPTYGVSQTRLAESCVVNNATSSIGQTEGTMFLDFVYENNGGGLYGQFVANATGFSDFLGWRVLDYNKTSLQILVRYNNVYQVIDDVASVFVIGNRHKVALKYSSGNIKVFVNNQEKFSSTATYPTPSVPLSKHTISGATINLVDSIQGDTISKINQSILFPTALSDDECIALTS